MVRLIRIRTLAEAGVPLARVQDLLAADDEEFAAAVAEIDRRLRDQVEQLQEHRRRIARLAAGDSLALPPSATEYLDRMRALGTPEPMVELERDAWILIAAQLPDRMDEFMADKQAQLDDPLMVAFLGAIGRVIDGGDESEAQLAEIADLVVAMGEQAAARGELEGQDEALPDGSFADLLDTVVLGAGPRLVRIRDRVQELMAERGWSGLVRMERLDRDRPR